MAFEAPGMRQILFLPTFFNGFLAALRLCRYALSKHIFLMSCLNRLRSIDPKNINFYATLWQYFAGEFF
jgi:hypothetical protein